MDQVLKQRLMMETYYKLMLDAKMSIRPPMMTSYPDLMALARLQVAQMLNQDYANALATPAHFLRFYNAFLPVAVPMPTFNPNLSPDLKDKLETPSTPTDDSPILKTPSSTSSEDTNGSDTPPKTPKFSLTFDSFRIIDGRSKKTLFNENNNTGGRYVCDKCSKSYATSSNLSRHKQTHRSLESGQAKQCPKCDKKYVSMPALSMHILTHDLKHKCPVCGKAFSRLWLLQGHLRSHTGEKPYGCAHCGKSFADRSNLRAHMQTHSPFKAYECKRCHKSFALKSYLNKHYESSCIKDFEIEDGMLE